MPAPKAPGACMGRSLIASDLMDAPLKVLYELGGWKTARTERLRKALEGFREANFASNLPESPLPRIP